MRPPQLFAGKIDENIAGDEEMIRALSPQILPSIESMVREQLHGIDIDTAFVEEMTKEDRVDFLTKASEVFLNPAFQRTIHYLISQQVDQTVKRAATMEEVFFGRATINGLSLCREQFEALDAQLQEIKKVEEKFDKTEII